MRVVDEKTLHAADLETEAPKDEGTKHAEDAEGEKSPPLAAPRHEPDVIGPEEPPPEAEFKPKRKPRKPNAFKGEIIIPALEKKECFCGALQAPQRSA